MHSRGSEPTSATPTGGLLRAIRQSLGLSLKAVAARLDVSPQAIHQFEKSEAAGTISLRQLGIVARAFGYRVAYQLVPESGGRKREAIPEAPTVAETPPAPHVESEVSIDRFSVNTD